MQDSLEDYIRISRNTKEEPIEIKKEVLITAHIKKECDVKAIQIVQLSIEGKLRPETLFRCLPFITSAHYQDIIEERAIIKLCGYPLCGKKIPEMPKKQYFISSKSNKVYDITERKNYCSNYCYKASMHIEKQIDDSPLWLRKYDQCPQYTLLHKSEKGLPGIVVDQGVSSRPPVEHFMSVTAFTEISLDEAEEIEFSTQEEAPKVPIKRPKRYQKKCLRTISESGETEEVEEAPKLEANNPPKEQFSSSLESPIMPRKSIENLKITSIPEKQELDVESQLNKAFHEWITLDTFVFIHGENRIRDKLNSDRLNSYFQQLEISEIRTEQQIKYLDICRKLHLQELADDKLDSLFTQNQLDKIPDYRQLKNDMTEGNQKVKAFYSGQLHVKDDPNFPSKANSGDDKENVEEEPAAVLPLLSSGSQKALRRQIFSNSLSKSMSFILQNLKLNPSSILSEVQQLVKTFNLKADNITFKPQVWTYISILMLRILGLVNEDIKLHLQKEHSRNYLNLLISDEKIILELSGIVEDIDEFLNNYFSSEQEINN